MAVSGTQNLGFWSANRRDSPSTIHPCINPSSYEELMKNWQTKTGSCKPSSSTPHCLLPSPSAFNTSSRVLRFSQVLSVNTPPPGRRPQRPSSKPFLCQQCFQTAFWTDLSTSPIPPPVSRTSETQSTPIFNHSCPAYILHTSRHLPVDPATRKTFLCLSPSLPTEVQSSLQRQSRVILLLTVFPELPPPF